MNRYLLVLAAVSLLSARCYAQEPTRGDVIRLIASQAKRQLGGRHADIEVPDGLLSNSAVELIGMPDGSGVEMERLNDGRYLISGCRPQSCSEKGAVVFGTAPPRIYALGFRNFHCRFVISDETKRKRYRGRPRANPPVMCDADPSLNIYLLKSENDGISSDQEQYYLSAFRNWNGGDRAREEVHIIITP